MHKTKRVRLVPTGLFDGEAIEADIDIKLVDIILGLWKLGIPTSYCCQGYPATKNKSLKEHADIRFAYISFPYADSALDFLNYFAQDSEDNYYKVVGHDWKRAWSCDVTVQGDGPFEPVRFFIAVRFPHSDIKFVKKRIKELTKNMK